VSGTEFAMKKGTVKFECHQDGIVKTFSLSHTYYLPLCSTPLISLTRLRRHVLVFSNAENGYTMLTDTNTGKTILHVPKRDGVYPLMTCRDGHGSGSGYHQLTLDPYPPNPYPIRVRIQTRTGTQLGLCGLYPGV
jgi:hypothetical protein